MRSSILLFALLLSASFAQAQRAGYTPPSVRPHEEATGTSAQGTFEMAKSQFDKRVAPIQRLSSADLAKLKQDADELATLAQSIPPDVDQTTKGLLPKDLGQKLKRIEKLSKQLRSRISH